MSDYSPIDSPQYTSIRFPSDSVTVAAVRRVHPNRFDVEDGRRFQTLEGEPEFTLGAALHVERILARAAYETARGNPDDYLASCGLSREDCLEDRTDFYRTYGVADGRRQTEELIRRIEAQAVEQVRGRDL